MHVKNRKIETCGTLAAWLPPTLSYQQLKGPADRTIHSASLSESQNKLDAPPNSSTGTHVVSQGPRS